VNGLYDGENGMPVDSFNDFLDDIGRSEWEVINVIAETANTKNWIMEVQAYRIFAKRQLLEYPEQTKDKKPAENEPTEENKVAPRRRNRKSDNTEA
jgi:hypothetical protein